MKTQIDLDLVASAPLIQDVKVLDNLWSSGIVTELLVEGPTTTK